MFYFMSKGDFLRVSMIVEVINGKDQLLSAEDSNKILAWVNEGNEKQFDEFCLAVNDELVDNYEQASEDDYHCIAWVINKLLKEW